VAARIWDGREEKGRGKTKKEAEMEAADRILSLLAGDRGIPAEE
jgi:dsRNA-specific ribonuclease